MIRRLAIRRETFPLAEEFRISRGAKSAAEVLVVEIGEDRMIGRGEAVPYGRYGETVEAVIAQIAALGADIEAGLGRSELQSRLPAGAARNAVDCALWDLDAKLAGVPAWQLAGLPSPPEPVMTAFTLSLGPAEEMAVAARRAAHRPILKIKLGGDEDLTSLSAIRYNAPHSRLVVDANEGWNLEQLATRAPILAELGVEVIEQPLPAGQDEQLRGLACPIRLGADESFHDRADIERLAGLYQVVNVKLDKTGGLTEALMVKSQAMAAGLEIMVGCMVATSLAMAPAMLLAQDAAFVDLDGPLLLAADRQPGLAYEGSLVHPPSAALWG